uniref:Protein SGT1 homolog n=1 Tax=Suricata suricatta TaxID=37032 RepID=A0A673SX27_SURSU
MAAKGGDWERRSREGPGRETQSSTVPARPALAFRLPSPPAARCVAARWLLRTEAQLVFLQKFPPWAAAQLLTSVVAALAATAIIRDGGSCSRTCNSAEVRVFLLSITYVYLPLPPTLSLVSMSLFFPGRFFRSFSDALIDEDPQAALEELTKALEQKPDDAQYYCQRAYCHILLGNYCDAVADAKKSLELNPDNSIAMLRKGICEYHEKNYAAALETFVGGQKLDSADPDFTVWIKRCQEAQDGSQSEVSASQRTHQSKIKYDWYQTESQVIITLMIKNVQKNNINVEFSEKELSASVKLPSGEDYNLKLRLLYPIIPQQSTFKVLSTKVRQFKKSC